MHFVVVWYIFPRFGMLNQENSGNPTSDFTYQTITTLADQLSLLGVENFTR
jgi:hypothetical protein